MTALAAVLLGLLGVAYAVWPRRGLAERGIGLEAGPVPNEGEVAEALRRWSEAAGEL